jgi:leader peptidase (prepilin peptidase)/N-methyltransferase
MAFILDFPLPVRVLIVLTLGLLAARLINWAIYTWAYFPRQLGPWSAPLATSKTKSKTKKSAVKNLAASRSWWDHLPIWGWYRLRHEQVVHGRWYWVRPLLIELCYPLILAWYYRFHISGGSLPPGTARFLAPLASQLHWQFLGHWVLLSLMIIATFIDFDEQTIPDLVTIPGTVIGLLGAGLAPVWLPLTPEFGAGAMTGIAELKASWPDGWALWMNSWWGLGLALAILLAWGFALLDRRLITRRGMAKAWVYFWARALRNRALVATVTATTISLMAFVVLVFWTQNGRWPYLLSSLIGMAVAGGMTWGVRLSASYGFGAEALGFGDVTLMAMIGAYVGWQPSLIIFFLAPMLALLFVIARWVVTRDTATPYGPYLCAAAAVLLVGWDSLWTRRSAPLFELGAGFIMGGLATCVVLIGVMLWIWQTIKRAVLGAG